MVNSAALLDTCLDNSQKAYLGRVCGNKSRGPHTLSIFFLLWDIDIKRGGEGGSRSQVATYMVV